MTTTVRRADFERNLRVIYPHPPRPVDQPRLSSRLVDLGTAPRRSTHPYTTWFHAAAFAAWAGVLILGVLWAGGRFS